MSDRKVVSCDTGFIIRLLSNEDSLSDNALHYFEHFLNEGYIIRLSTIAIAEYCVRADFETLPLANILVSPFNAIHAKFAGECANILFKANSKGIIELDRRILIQNDVKIMAQAQKDHSLYFLTADTKSKRMYDILRKAGVISFDFLDIHTPCQQAFGEIVFPD